MTSPAIQGAKYGFWLNIQHPASLKARVSVKMSDTMKNLYLIFSVPLKIHFSTENLKFIFRCLY